MTLQFEAHALIFHARLQNRLHNFAHSSVTWKTQTEKLSLGGQEELQKISLICFLPLYYAFFIFKSKISVPLKKSKKRTRSVALDIRG